MELSKAYDGQALLKALEQEGVQGGIDVVKKAVSVLADFLRSSAALSTTGLVGHLDDFAVPGINYFEKLALAELNKLQAGLSVVAPEAAAAPAEPVVAPVVAEGAAGGDAPVS